MAIGFILEFPGGTQAQYDAVMQDLDLGGKLPPGGLSHFAAATENGWTVVDLWESPEAFDAFFKSKLEGALRNNGIQPPQVTLIPAYNYMLS